LALTSNSQCRLLTDSTDTFSRTIRPDGRGRPSPSQMLNISLHSSKRPAPMPDTTPLLSLGQGGEGFGTALAGGAGGSGLVVLTVGVLALVVMKLLSERPGNDDDDSTPGGGLMQPVA
jgi:hypothetical protein